jgi:hypothetical protein
LNWEGKLVGSSRKYLFEGQPKKGNGRKKEDEGGGEEAIEAIGNNSWRMKKELYKNNGKNVHLGDEITIYCNMMKSRAHAQHRGGRLPNLGHKNWDGLGEAN